LFSFSPERRISMSSNEEKKDITNKLRKYPPVLTVKDICEILKFRPTKVYGMISNGEIKRIERSGRHIRVLKADVIEFLIAHKSNG
jgi:excisionase family DNA binding protein